MKTMTFILALTLCVAARTMASDPKNDDGTTAAKLEANTVFTVSPYVQTKSAKDEGKIYRVGGMSSEPWSQIASRNAREPSTLTEMQNQECGLPLFWIGAEPKPWRNY